MKNEKKDIAQTDNSDSNDTKKIASQISIVLSSVAAAGCLFYQTVNNFFCENNIHPMEECHLPTEWDLINSIGMALGIYGIGISCLCLGTLIDYQQLPNDDIV